MTITVLILLVVLFLLLEVASVEHSAIRRCPECKQETYQRSTFGFSWHCANPACLFNRGEEEDA